MQKILNIAETKDTPSVVFDKANGKFELKGKSLPEDVNEYYDELIAWLEEYKEDPNPETIFTFNLEYYNSASVRKIVDILLILDNIHKAGKKVLVRWLYADYDDKMGEVGEDFKILVELPFEIVSFSKED